MTTITASIANPYPLSAPKTASAEAEGSSPLAPAKESQDGQGKELRVDAGDANIDAVTAGGDQVKALQKQIEQTQKTLTEQQAQLANVQKGQASDQQKAQQMMEVQAQIAVTNSTLQVLQAALVQAMFSVDVHA
ncbi:hypothetical protein ACXM5X_06395 [Pseudomonas saponiphila]|uniref:FlxA-like protein n=1 Tax=Pseudomonas saponiphila TaxID=556534 RepID=A0A1H4K7E7_9PSED|nr:hypothetical protein [Pseudomonas saponiphila]SEB54460.1 hypothetical protein SAMN05216178_1107 [Pseudomonas saponiphila]